jgi:hypothetical protein
VLDYNRCSRMVKKKFERADQRNLQLSPHLTLVLSSIQQSPLTIKMDCRAPIRAGSV